MPLITNIKTIFSNSRGWFLFCLSAIAIGLSLSKPLISLGITALFLVWVFDGDIVGKLKAFFSNKTALMLSGIYFISILGLLYTSNFDFALVDLRRKIILFALPFLLTGFSPITQKELHFLLKIFMAGVVASTLWSLFIYFGGLHTVVIDTRSLSRFTSHIRFGLAIALTTFLAIYFFQKESRLVVKALWVIVFLWMIFTLILFNLFTGGIVLVLTTIFLIFLYGYYSKNRIKKRAAILTFLLLVFGSIFHVNNTIQKFYQAEKISPLKTIPFTKNGEKYQSSTDAAILFKKENGYYINKNIAWNEFSNAWNKRSKIDFNGKDLKGQNLQETLIRFITSKGQRKDKEAIDALSGREIDAIERGVPNHKYLEMNYFNVRLHKIIWEYNTYVKTGGKNINGHSVLMRWVYWKTAVNIIKNNFVLGVGTGDVQDAFNQQYNLEKSPLLKENRLRSHNQFLTYWITLGIVGLGLFLLCLFIPIVQKRGYKNYCYMAFFSIFFLSMLTEDTLETQVGVTFFTFFNSLFMLNNIPNEPK